MRIIFCIFTFNFYKVYIYYSNDMCGWLHEYSHLTYLLCSLATIISYDWEEMRVSCEFGRVPPFPIKSFDVYAREYGNGPFQVGKWKKLRARHFNALSLFLPVGTRMEIKSYSLMDTMRMIMIFFIPANMITYIFSSFLLTLFTRIALLPRGKQRQRVFLSEDDVGMSIINWH